MIRVLFPFIHGSMICHILVGRYVVSNANRFNNDVTCFIIKYDCCVVNVVFKSFHYYNPLLVVIL